MQEFKNVDITEYSTFKLKAFAKRFVVLSSLEEIEKFFTSDSDGMFGNYYLVGEGSNTFFSKEIHCLVTLNSKGIDWSKSEEGVVTVSAGENWDDFVHQSVLRGFGGVEALAAIPGTVGAAPVQNIGAYGTEFSDVGVSVRFFDRQEKVFKNFSKQECEFSYRDSVFKRNKNRFIIISTDIQLKPYKEGDGVSIPKYPGVKEEIQKALYSSDKSLNKSSSDTSFNEEKMRVSPLVVYEAIAKIRSGKLPNYKEIPNVGSCFENPIIKKGESEKLLLIYPTIPVYEVPPIYEVAPLYKVGDVVKISAGWLIEQCDLKGFFIGGVSVYEKHALILVNKKQEGTFEELQELVSIIKSRVKNKFGIDLRLEPNVVL